MKSSVVILGVIAGLFACAASQVRADDMGDLCAILNKSRNNQAALNQHLANEPNPLKREALQRQLEEVGMQERTSLSNFLSGHNLRFANFHGTVRGFQTISYGARLSIDLPCGTSILFQFIDAKGGFSGQPDPELNSSFSDWRSALEEIADGDSVTFSGRFTPGPGSHNAMGKELWNPRGIDRAILTELRTKGGVVYKVPDPLVVMENARHEDELQKDKIIQGIADQLSGKWSGEWELGGFVNPMAVNKGTFSLDLKRNGSVITGTYYERGGSAEMEGSIDGAQISFGCEYTDGSSRRFVGTMAVTGEVSGKWDQKNGSGTWKMAKKSPP